MSSNCFFIWSFKANGTLWGFLLIGAASPVFLHEILYWCKVACQNDRTETSHNTRSLQVPTQRVPRYSSALISRLRHLPMQQVTNYHHLCLLY